MNLQLPGAEIDLNSSMTSMNSMSSQITTRTDDLRTQPDKTQAEIDQMTESQVTI